MSKKTMNTNRADWAMAAVIAFAVRTGLIGPNQAEASWLETAVSDLLIDLMHLCNQKGLNFNEILNNRALPYYLAEVEDPEPYQEDA